MPDPATTTQERLLALADERFVSLTTFRRSGEPVSTPVWIARDADALIVTTTASTGKVRRLRRDARVELTPCDRRGRVRDPSARASAHAVIDAEPGDVERAGARIAAKYGLEYRLVRLAERVVGRGRGARVILRIDATD